MSWHVYAKINLDGWADEALPESERLFYSHWRGPYEDKELAVEIAKKFNLSSSSHVIYGIIESKIKTIHKIIYPRSNKKVRVGTFQEV